MLLPKITGPLRYFPSIHPSPRFYPKQRSSFQKNLEKNGRLNSEFMSNSDFAMIPRILSWIEKNLSASRLCLEHHWNCIQLSIVQSKQ